MIVGFGDQHRQLFESLHPRHVEVIDFNLEDAFIEYTRGPRRGLPIFAEDRRRRMFRAMAIKELRELRGIGLLALAANVYLVAACANPPVVSAGRPGASAVCR